MSERTRTIIAVFMLIFGLAYIPCNVLIPEILTWSETEYQVDILIHDKYGNGIDAAKAIAFISPHHSASIADKNGLATVYVWVKLKTYWMLPLKEEYIVWSGISVHAEGYVDHAISHREISIYISEGRKSPIVVQLRKSP